MAIPNKQIGWSQEAILMWEILKNLERATKIAGGGGIITTTTTTTAP